MKGRRGSPQIRVVQSIKRSRDQPTYEKHLAGVGGDGVSVAFFSWPLAVLGAYDVFHLHWPEHVLGARRGLVGLIKYALTRALIARLKLTRTPVVRTVHNLKPHDQQTDRWLADIERRFDALVASRIHLVAPSESSAGGPTDRTIPHASYTEQFANMRRSARVDGRVVSVGLIRKYKGLERLVRAFEACDKPGLTLRIVGGPTDAKLVSSLQRAADHDWRIAIRAEFVSDEELVHELTAAQLVVLPYVFHSSGVALAALSVGRPILTPDCPSSRALEREVGESWVYRYQGDLSSVHIEAALSRAAALKPHDRPDLSKREPLRIAAAHREVYRSVVSVPRNRRQGSRSEDSYG